VNAAWRGFVDEIARARDAGRAIDFWWRDDDASRPGPALARLLGLCARSSVPLALAVIPLEAQAPLFAGLREQVSVLQHGTDHLNRAEPGSKKSEYPVSEPFASALGRIAAARARLEQLAGPRFVPVLAPPWNRMPRLLAARLAEVGLRGLSQYGARAAASAAAGVAQVNTHVDLIAWRGGRGFAGEEATLAAASAHLAGKRSGSADGGEATGWLTHHAAHDEAAWSFLERLFETTATIADVRWRAAPTLFRVA